MNIRRSRSLHIWVLWAIGALVLAACPMLLSEPAMWPFILDPELLALVIIVGAQYTGFQFVMIGVRVRVWLAAIGSAPARGKRFGNDYERQRCG
jgi:hypothetical protein